MIIRAEWDAAGDDSERQSARSGRLPEESGVVVGEGGQIREASCDVVSQRKDKLETELVSEGGC